MRAIFEAAWAVFRGAEAMWL